VLNKAGSGNNKEICKAKITITEKPILRKSPFAGMLFNGLGRPIQIDGYANTLPASMGGNKTPIIDEEELYNNKEGWVQNYHSRLLKGEKPMKYQIAPKRLRRITVKEAALLQTFPADFEFFGSQSSRYSQIGNAVPCNLASRVAEMMKGVLESNDLKDSIIEIAYQPEFEF